MLSEADVLSQALKELNDRLPPGWQVAQVARTPSSIADAVVRFVEPGGRTSETVLEVKIDASPRVVRLAVAQLRAVPETMSPILVAPYLSQRSRQLATEAGINYLDLSGNIRIVLRDPPLFLRDCGSDVNPFPQNRPERSLSGPRAGRVLLTLCELKPPFDPWALTMVAGESKVSLSYVSRVVDVLEREDLIRRARRGPILEVDRPGLVRRWAEDYSLLTSNTGRLYLDPRGAARTLENLGSLEFQRAVPRYAITGSFAASRFASVAPPSKLVCFVEYPDSAAQALGLSPATGVGNVFLLAPYDPIVFERVVAGDDGKAWATAGQVILDCLTGPDRMPEEGEALLAYMRRTNAGWRGFQLDRVPR